MPSLEDTPNLASKAAPSGSDLVSIFDVSERGNSKIKKATLLQALTAVVAGVPGPFFDDAAAAIGGVAVGSLYLNDGLGQNLLAIRSV